MQPNTQHRPDPWTGEKAHRTSADALFAPPRPAKSGHALETPTSKIGSLLLLLAISGVAAVGVFMPEEAEPLNPAGTASAKSHLPRSENTLMPQDLSTSSNVSQQAYALAYELARERVQTVDGLTRQQRLDAARQALAQVMGGNNSLDAEATVALAKRAPQSVKNAAFRGVVKGEASGISAQSQSVIERLLRRAKPTQ